MATIDDLQYPDADAEAESEHLRARARQTLRLLNAHEVAAFQEFGGSDRLVVASNLGVHEFSYRPAPDDPGDLTVGHVLTRWPNVKGVEMALRFPRADSPRYGVHVSIREPGIPGDRERGHGRQRAPRRVRQRLRRRDRAPRHGLSPGPSPRPIARWA